MDTGMIKQLLRAGSVMVILMAVLNPGIAGAHGKVSLEDDLCVRRVGGNMVHFNAYQPQFEPKAQYCTDIPEEGDTYLVLDLVDPGLRQLPVGIRVVKGANGAAEDQTVAYWPPASHPDGVVRGEAKLEKGLYSLVITAEGLSPSAYQLRVQMVDYSKVAKKITGPLVGLLILALVIYELRKSKRVRNWFSSART
jgi:hypothetical protein